MIGKIVVKGAHIECEGWQLVIVKVSLCRIASLRSVSYIKESIRKWVNANIIIVDFCEIKIVWGLWNVSVSLKLCRMEM